MGHKCDPLPPSHDDGQAQPRQVQAGRARQIANLRPPFPVVARAPATSHVKPARYSFRPTPLLEHCDGKIINLEPMRVVLQSPRGLL